MDGLEEKSKEVFALIKQKPNKKILGFIPFYLNLYNLSSPRKTNHYFKKIGEAPILLNQRLTKKSTSQIELYYKNKGFFDVTSSAEIHKKKHKAKVVYKVNSGEVYQISRVTVNENNANPLNLIVLKFLEDTDLKKGKPYQFDVLEKERANIASKLQNQGYYQFNKEFIHFIADTNQQTKEVHLDLVIKSIEKNENNTTTYKKHTLGIIRDVFVFHDTNASESKNDTSIVNGIHFIHNSENPPFNLNRLAEKILIKPGIPYNKSIIDQSHSALSELKNFKKITFDFSPTGTQSEEDLLRAIIHLIPGKKIAYTVELEASTNPELKEGIAGAASLSHFNFFRGAEHLELIYKGSKNINLNDANSILDIRENRLVLNLSIPSIISPFKQKTRDYSKARTVFSTSISEQQRPEFTRNSISGNLTYQWNTKRNREHKLTLFNLSYVNFQGESANLNNISEYLIAKDYSSHLIPTSSYTLSINDQKINKLKNYSFLRFHIESSGNLLRGMAKPLNLSSVKDSEGNPALQDNGNRTYTVSLGNNENIFTQYIKTSLDFRHYWKLDEKNSFAARAMAGVIYAYGNTNQAPFQKKFIAGGANDLRGWQAFKKPTGNLSSNSDTLYTGGVKLLASIEYRFNIINKLKGALFIDAGNIWELNSNNEKYESANFEWNQFLNEISMNTGFGLRYDFKYFVLRTDLGFPFRNPNERKSEPWNKISLRNSQLNIGLGYPF